MLAYAVTGEQAQNHPVFRESGRSRVGREAHEGDGGGGALPTGPSPVTLEETPAG